MKRLEILLVNDTNIDIKTDYKYVVTQVTTYEDALIKFQTENYDVVAFPKDFQNVETINMIQKLVNVQNMNTQIIFFDKDVNLVTEFGQLYNNQSKDSDFEIDIQDDALKNNNRSCSL